MTAKSTIQMRQVSAAKVVLVDGLWTASDVADFFKVTKRQVFKWVKAGQLKSVCTPGGEVRFEYAEIKRVLESSQVNFKL